MSVSVLGDLIEDLPRVMMRVSLSKSTILRLERTGQFPGRIRLSQRRVGWRKSEIDRWLAERASVDNRGQTDDLVLV
jgi:prophage regulatory protein